MEENVALDSSKQKDFVKSVIGIKKLLKNKDKKRVENVVVNKKSDEGKKKTRAKKSSKRGLVYLSHIPHGFYEHEMTEYFKQFGLVTNARVIRSRRTGNSKGYAFVEFYEPDVAQIVAETMNNYLMGKRLIKAVYIPPEKQRKDAVRKKWNPQKNPTSDERLKIKMVYNSNKSDELELKIARKLLTTLSKTKKKLSQLGIDYDFFKPVDVPESLLDKIDNIILPTDTKLNEQVKNESKELKTENLKEIKVELKKDVTEKIKKEQPKKKDTKNSDILVKKSVNSNNGKLKDKNKQNNKEVNNIKTDKPKQKKSAEKVLKSNIKSPDNFISIKKQDSSDSSVDFDSDEFEKLIEKENNDSTSDEYSESEEIQNVSSQVDKNTNGSENKKIVKTDVNKKKIGNQSAKTQLIKRKITKSITVPPKRTKFEKQNSKMPLKKVTKINK